MLKYFTGYLHPERVQQVKVSGIHIIGIIRDYLHAVLNVSIIDTIVERAALPVGIYPTHCHTSTLIDKSANVY